MGSGTLKGKMIMSLFHGLLDRHQALCKVLEMDS